MKILREKKLTAALLAAALLIGLLVATAVGRAHSAPQYLHDVPSPTPGFYMVHPNRDGCIR